MNRLPSIRRWGVAALTGVTLFGGLSIVGAGVASAATTPTVSSAITAGSAATTIAGTVTPTAANAANLTLTVNGPIASGDQITLTLGCPTTGSASFTAVPGTITSSGTAAWAGTAPINNSSGCSTETLIAGAADTSASSTIALSGIEITTLDVSSQALVVTGTYSTLGLTATSFSVPTIASVSWFSVTTNTPSVTLPTSGTTAISPISITEPANVPVPVGNLAAGDIITLSLPAAVAPQTVADTFGLSTTLSTVGGTATLSGQGTSELTITINTVQSATGSMLFTLNNATVTTTNAPVGAQTITISSQKQTAVGPPAVYAAAVSIANGSAGSILGSVTTIYGPNGTADGTVAAEFESAFPADASTQSGGNTNVVLATDTPHTNGSDALAASYLEGTLGTGLLITPATTLGTDAQQAMRIEGVTTVYVVGGPLAITPAVIAEVQALPAYFPGGLVQRGTNVKVVGPIYGSDGTAEGTAAAIATRYGTAFGTGSFAGAYNATGGMYNTTTGSASTVAPTGSVPTAIVVASTDWQDAMSIAPEAYRSRFPVILAGPSTSTTLGADAQAALTTLGVKQVIVIGGQLALQNSVEAQIAALNGGISVLRIAGIDATDTAAQIANFALGQGTTGLAWTAGNHAVIASHGDYWTDALGAAALGGGANQTFGTEPIILVQNPTTVGQYTTAELAVLAGLTAPAGPIYNLTVLGGPLAMPSSTVQTLLAGL